MLITAPTINNGDPIDPTVIQAFIDQVDELRSGNIDHDNMSLAKPYMVAPLKGWHFCDSDSHGAFPYAFVPVPITPDYLMVPFRLPPMDGKLDPKQPYYIRNVLVTGDAYQDNDILTVTLHRYPDETYGMFGPALLTARLTPGFISGTHEWCYERALTGGGSRSVNCNSTDEFFAWHLTSNVRASEFRQVSIQGEVWYYPFDG